MEREVYILRKRYYIFFVCRDAEGQIRKIPIPIHYLYVFLAGAVIGMFTITGMAGSYTRMLAKVSRFNQLRSEKEIIANRYTQLEQVEKEKDTQVASLGSLANEVSSLYGLKTDPVLENAISGSFNHQQVSSSLDRLTVLRASALTGVTSIALSSPPVRNATTADWMRLAELPNLWPVEGMITASFGERIDPFNGEGAFHSGIDISAGVGHPVIAAADGIVTMAETAGGYGRLVQINHSHGVSTRYGHLSAFGVSSGQRVHRGDIIGYVGVSGRSTGPHLHYEVRINNAPVNPYKYLRTTLAQSVIPNPSGL